MSLPGLQERVVEMASRRRDLAEIEHAIDAARVDDEEKSALWLLAWRCRQSDLPAPARGRRVDGHRFD